LGSLGHGGSMTSRAISGGVVMGKPFNKIAGAVWILAAVIAAGDILYLFAFSHITLTFTAPPGRTYEWIANVWVSVRGPILTIGQLVALGAVIELLDQIRWNAIRNRTEH